MRWRIPSNVKIFPILPVKMLAREAVRADRVVMAAEVVAEVVEAAEAV